jgi:CRISPR type I-E-associated protein CasB/Cse2
MDTETTTTHNPNAEFLARLRKVAADRGNRAMLRRYWSPATRHQAYPLLGKLGAIDDQRKALVAALYAEHPEHRQGTTVGVAARKIPKLADGEHPYERHFLRLLACEDLADLGQQLHRLVRRLAREGVGLDYEDLHKRLNFWANHRESVKVLWASGFWQSPQPVNPSTGESA